MLMLNGSMVIQTYFALSGFLLAVRFVASCDGDERVKIGQIFFAAFYRLTR